MARPVIALPGELGQVRPRHGEDEQPDERDFDGRVEGS